MHLVSTLSQFLLCFDRYTENTRGVSSRTGKASRTLVESRGLPSDSTCVLKALPSRLDIKRYSKPLFCLSVYKLVHSLN